jgi:hypothetical protein
MKSLCIGLSLLLIMSTMSSYASAQCTATLCGANGVCNVVNNAPVCTCKPGWVGSRCTIADPCAPKPCGVGGACFPLISTIGGTEVSDIFCQCYAGYSGNRCQNGMIN